MQNYWRKEIEKHGGKFANSVIGNHPFAAENFNVVGHGLYFLLLKQQIFKKYRNQNIPVYQLLRLV